MADNLPTVAATGGTLAALLADPDKLREIPVETVERLFALNERMVAAEARRNFDEAFNRVQSRMEPVRKRGKGVHGSQYAKLEDVCAMLDPLLVEEGFSRSTSEGDSPKPGHMRIVLTLRNSGHSEQHFMDAPADTKGSSGPASGGNKTALHGIGSTYTYCERKLLCHVCGVQTVPDDDGMASGKIGQGAARISEAQATEIERLLEERGADKVKFCEVFEVDAIRALPVHSYRPAIQMITSKRRAS